jgi:D-xylonolactonase
MTTDAKGQLWIAHWGADCVTCHDPASAAELARILLPTTQITSCVFGGPDLRTLYITSAWDGLTIEKLKAQPLDGGLFSVEIDEPSVPAHLFAG